MATKLAFGCQLCWQLCGCLPNNAKRNEDQKHRPCIDTHIRTFRLALSSCSEDYRNLLKINTRVDYTSCLPPEPSTRDQRQQKMRWTWIISAGLLLSCYVSLSREQNTTTGKYMLFVIQETFTLESLSKHEGFRLKLWADNQIFERRRSGVRASWCYIFF